MSDVKYLARKVLNLRIWPDGAGKMWTTNLVQNDYEVLVVSQFTLYGVLKGNKPDFHGSLGPEPALVLYNSFLQELRDVYQSDRIANGSFGNKMDVALHNDGPVTLTIDSPQKKKKPAGKGKEEQKVRTWDTEANGRPVISFRTM